jgi:hypothetical protein
VPGVKDRLIAPRRAQVDFDLRPHEDSIVGQVEDVPLLDEGQQLQPPATILVGRLRDHAADAGDRLPPVIAAGRQNAQGISKVVRPQAELLQVVLTTDAGSRLADFLHSW